MYTYIPTRIHIFPHMYIYEYISCIHGVTIHIYIVIYKYIIHVRIGHRWCIRARLRARAAVIWSMLIKKIPEPKRARHNETQICQNKNPNIPIQAHIGVKRRLNQKTLYFIKRALHLSVQPCIWSVKPCIPSKEPYILLKQPYISSKQPYNLSKEPYTQSKEHCILSVEPCISSKDIALRQTTWKWRFWALARRREPYILVK